MKTYENDAIEAIVRFFDKEPVWKKEVLFNFLLEPFHLDLKDIKDVIPQDNQKGTISDFSIITNDDKKIRFEVKIKNTRLPDYETKKDARDAFLIRKNYPHMDKIPGTAKILYWDDLYEKIDTMGAKEDFTRLDLVRDIEFSHEVSLLPRLCLYFSPHEVAMLYSPKTVAAVYKMSVKVIELCKKFFDAHKDLYEPIYALQGEGGIGYRFNDKKAKRDGCFMGLAPFVEDEDYCFAVAVDLGEYPDTMADYKYGGWAYFPLDKEILAADEPEVDVQERFNKNVEEVLGSIK